MEDPSETLDPDWLQRLIGTLKDGEVAHFRYGELELSFIPEDAQPFKGFVPKEQTAGETAKDSQTNQYHKAFGGNLPGFTKAKPPEDKG